MGERGQERGKGRERMRELDRGGRGKGRGEWEERGGGKVTVFKSFFPSRVVVC